jgi:hypothetical protein
MNAVDDDSGGEACQQHEAQPARHSMTHAENADRNRG